MGDIRNVGLVDLGRMVVAVFLAGMILGAVGIGAIGYVLVWETGVACGGGNGN